MQAIGMVSPAQRPRFDSLDLGKDREIVARRRVIYIYHCESRWVGWRNRSILGHFPPVPTWSWWEILSEFAASSTIIGTIIWTAVYRTKKGWRLSSVIFCYIELRILPLFLFALGFHIILGGSLLNSMLTDRLNSACTHQHNKNVYAPNHTPW